MDDFEQPITAE